MSHLIKVIRHLHDVFFDCIIRITKGWFLAFSARFVFASVLFMYFFKSASSKVGDALFEISGGAYYQIIPKIFEAVGQEPDAVAFFPWKLIIYFGTYAEFIVPIFIVIGLFARLSAAAMIGFIIVQSFVDIYSHEIGSAAGKMFDQASNGLIWDQRLLWLFMLVVIIIKGAGYLSIDHLLKKFFDRRPL